MEFEEEEAEEEEDDDEVVGCLDPLRTVFLLVKEGISDPAPIPFFSGSRVEEVFRSSLVSCNVDTPAAPVAPETLAEVPLKMGRPAPTEDDVLLQGILPSCRGDETLDPEPNLPG